MVARSSFGMVRRKSPHKHQPHAHCSMAVTHDAQVFPTRRKRSFPSNKHGGIWEWTDHYTARQLLLLAVCLGTGAVLIIYVTLARTIVRTMPYSYFQLRNRGGGGASAAPYHPRVVFFVDPHESHSVSNYVQAWKHMLSPRNTSIEPISSHNIDSTEDSNNTTDALETNDCQAMHPWQLQSLPACNSIHEIDMTMASTLVDPPPHKSPVFLTSGYWRDVWVLRNFSTMDDKVVYKTMRFMHNVTHRNFDRNRRDALVSERLTGSPWVLDVYGFCGNTGLSEFADGGDLSEAIWNKAGTHAGQSVRNGGNLTHQEQLELAVQAAIGLAALHNFDKEGQPSVAHTDISPGQWVRVRQKDGQHRFKLQDFNRARFIQWDEKHGKACPYNISKSPGKNRSPEEYLHQPLTEKVDVYSLGNLFYMLLQKEWPFRSEATQNAQSRVKKGYRPDFYEDVWNSGDPYDMALKEAMLMCHEQQPADRASAREVANYLKKQLETLSPGALAKWGEPQGPVR